MLETGDLQQYLAQYPSASAYLLDAFGGQQSGGSGQSYDWFHIPQELSQPLMLAGGIQAENVQQALKLTGAKYIDTSSGIESTPGVKSSEKMKALMQAIRAFDQV